MDLKNFLTCWLVLFLVCLFAVCPMLSVFLGGSIGNPVIGSGILSFIITLLFSLAGDGTN